MRNPLNKARIPENSEPIQEQDPITNPELQKIMNLVNGINRVEPGTREDLLKGRAQAQAAQIQAAEAKEAAETEADFDKACDDAIRAREKEEFFQRLIDKLDFTPRMSEEDYFAALDSIRSVMKGAAEEFKETARKAMAELVRARNEYLQLMKESDRVLIALDNSSKVLQTKYRYRKDEYSDGTFTMTEDPNEWTRHIVRYGQGKAVDLIFKDEHDPILPAWREARNEIACAAWCAAERVSR